MVKPKSNGTMKAARLHVRGGPEQIVYESAPVPAPAVGEVLVRVCATGITPSELLWRETYSNPDGSERLPTIPGHEVSGVINSLGSDIEGLREGDPVYGLVDFPKDGAAAEYLAVRAANLAPKPACIDHGSAAAVPLSALTAWQALFDHAKLNSGQRVLIHGAAGGVGTFAVQLARSRGVRVIATASGHNVDFLRQLGADEVIDYTAAPFETCVSGLDAVLDTIGGETLQRSFGILKKGGALVSIVEPVSNEESTKHGVRGIFFIVEPKRDQLAALARLIDEDLVEPVVEEMLPLSDARHAFELGATGHTRGKIVLCVDGYS